MEEEEDMESSVEQKWLKLKEKVLDSMIRRKRIRRKKELGYKDWWDRECTRKKREEDIIGNGDEGKSKEKYT